MVLRRVEIRTGGVLSACSMQHNMSCWRFLLKYKQKYCSVMDDEDSTAPDRYERSCLVDERMNNPGNQSGALEKRRRIVSNQQTSSGGVMILQTWFLPLINRACRIGDRKTTKTRLVYAHGRTRQLARYCCAV